MQIDRRASRGLKIEDRNSQSSILYPRLFDDFGSTASHTDPPTPLGLPKQEFLPLDFRFWRNPVIIKRHGGTRLKSPFTSLGKIFSGWRMCGLVSAMRILGGGLHNYGFTVFFLPLSQDLGLSRPATSLAFSLARAEGAFEGPFVGYFIDRFGPRPMMLIATLLTGAGYILLAWVDSYTTFLIVYLGIISLSFPPGFVHASMAVGNTWFIRYRARAMTVISSAVPIGGTLLTPLLAG